MNTHNPFKYGGPVNPEQFVDRIDVVSRLFSRLRNGDSTAVVGEPLIGKTSLLHYVSDPDVRKDNLENEISMLAFIKIDCQRLGGSKDLDFWVEVLTIAKEEFRHRATSRQINVCIEKLRNGASLSFSLPSFFEELGKKKKRVVVLIDEFDFLIQHPNFRTTNFFPLLRSLATSTKGLVIITSSRSPINKLENNLMEERSLSLGSPPLNYFAMEVLKPFESEHLDQMLEKALKGTEVKFRSEDKDLIWQESKGHPYLAQCLAWFLFDEYAKGNVEDKARIKVMPLYYQQIACHANLWPNLNKEEEAYSAPPIIKRNEKNVRIESNHNLRCAIILTALPIEYNAVRVHLTNLRKDQHPQGTVYYRGNFLTAKHSLEVGIVEIGAGNAGAARETERMIQYFKPSVALFVGVAGGIKDVKLGDIVAATKVYCYESGKSEMTFRMRPDVGESTYSLIQQARAVAKEEEWSQRIKDSKPIQPPNIFVAPIASGEKVVASTRSTVWKFIRNNYNDACAVDMEGCGFLKAIHANPSVDALIIRGISDLVDDKSIADAEGSQDIASKHASAFAFEILAKL